MREEALRQMARRYSRLIRSAVARVAGPSFASIGDDVEQKVLIALWKAMPGEQMPDHPTSYIYRAAVRETVHAVRGMKQTVELEKVVEKADHATLPDAIAESNDLGRAIQAALSEIPADRRRAVMAHLGGYGVREIMVMYDWPYNKARNLISRGMADLRRKLRSRGLRD